MTKQTELGYIGNQERILEIADEIIVVADGKIDRMGPRDEILPSLIGTTSAVGTCAPLGGKPMPVPSIPAEETAKKGGEA